MITHRRYTLLFDMCFISTCEQEVGKLREAILYLALGLLPLFKHLSASSIPNEGGYRHYLFVLLVPRVASRHVPIFSPKERETP